MTRLCEFYVNNPHQECYECASCKHSPYNIQASREIRYGVRPKLHKDYSMGEAAMLFV